jgi:MFS family permease
MAQPGGGFTPCPTSSALSGWPALAPFRTRSFRYQWPADLCTAWALEMETLILGWYVLVESGSVVLLTVFGALMYVGTLVSPLLGMLGDRLGLRRVLAAMRLSYALLAGVILLLAATGRLDPTRVLAVAFVVGLIKPTDIGMRTALVSAAVPAAQLLAAMGISRTTQDSARIGGALAGAGFMASLGLVSAYVAITAIYLVGALQRQYLLPGAWFKRSMGSTRRRLQRPERSGLVGVADVVSRVRRTLRRARGHNPAGPS